MAVNLSYPEAMHPVKGISLAATAAGLKKNGNSDMVLIACDEGTQAAAVFTQNAYCAAPVTVAKQHLEQSAPRLLLINAGNANAGTGEQGMHNARESCAYLAKKMSLSAEQALPFSTGVIAEQLPMPVIRDGIEKLVGQLDADHWLPASQAIMTTDTLPKGFSEIIEIDGVPVTVTGMSKGSGMICPNMATMLAYIATDASVDKKSLQSLLSAANERSFNSITVDGDTSTNDACVLLATGQAKNVLLDENHPQWNLFAECIERACITLAQAIIRDGEGVTKFIEVAVSEGNNIDECRQVAYTVAHSPLVKTAFFASDPNLGRLLMAIGRSGIDNLNIGNVSLWLDNVAVVCDGEPAPDYTEERGQAVMNQDEICVRISLGRGQSNWSIWTTDFSYDYVKINAEYRS